MAESLLSTVSGTCDLLPDGLDRWQLVEEKARDIFARYVFREIRTLCHIEFAGGSLKSRMRMANRLNAKHALIIGESELARNLCTIRRMDNSDQQEISPDEIGGYLRSHCK